MRMPVIIASIFQSGDFVCCSSGSSVGDGSPKSPTCNACGRCQASTVPPAPCLIARIRLARLLGRGVLSEMRLLPMLGGVAKHICNKLTRKFALSTRTFRNIQPRKQSSSDFGCFGWLASVLRGCFSQAINGGIAAQKTVRVRDAPFSLVTRVPRAAAVAGWPAFLTCLQRVAYARGVRMSEHMPCPQFLRLPGHSQGI